MNLHSFSSRGSGVCRSLFLRTLMVMMLFITGSNGIHAGEDKTATLSDPASHGSWNNAMELTNGWDTKGLIVKIDFEEEGKNCAKIGEEMTATNHTDNFSFVQFKGEVPESGYKLYNLHRADNIQTWDKSAVIQKDEIFGYYFQNIPKAQFYDRSASVVS